LVLRLANKETHGSHPRVRKAEKVLAETRLWTKEYVIIGLVNLLTAMNFYLLMIIVSEYAMITFDSTPGEAGFAASIFIIGALIARLFAGKWMMRVGYKQMLGVGVVACLVMTLFYFGVNSVIILLLVRFFHGAAFGITTTAAATIVSDIIPPERRGEGIGYYSLSQTVATAIGPFVGIFLSQHGSYSMIFVACSLVAGVSLLLSPFLSLRQRVYTEEQLQETKGFKLSNLVETRVIPIAIVCLLIYLGYSSIVSFLTVYAKEIHLVDAASFFFIVYAALVLVSRPVVGRVFDLKGENSIMYLAIVVFASGVFLLSRSYHGYELLLAAALVGLGFGAIQSSTQAIAVKITPLHRLGLANSTYFMFSDIGMGIGPLLVGFIIPFTGYRGMYTVVSFVALACLVIYFFVHGRTVKSGEQEQVFTRAGI
jgi:MFS family permease